MKKELINKVKYIVLKLPISFLLVFLAPIIATYAVFHFDRYSFYDTIKGMLRRWWLCFTVVLGGCISSHAGWYIRKTSYGNGPRKWFFYKPRVPWMMETWFLQR